MKGAEAEGDLLASPLLSSFFILLAKAALAVNVLAQNRLDHFDGVYAVSNNC